VHISIGGEEGEHRYVVRHVGDAGAAMHHDERLSSGRVRARDVHGELRTVWQREPSHTRHRLRRHPPDARPQPAQAHHRGEQNQHGRPGDGTSENRPGPSVCGRGGSTLVPATSEPRERQASATMVTAATIADHHTLAVPPATRTNAAALASDTSTAKPSNFTKPRIAAEPEALTRP